MRWFAVLIMNYSFHLKRGGSKSNFFILPSNTSYGMRSGNELQQQTDYSDSSPRRLPTLQTLRGPNVRGSPHPYRTNRSEGQRSRCHTPDNLLNSEATVGSRPQSIHDVPHSSNSGCALQSFLSESSFFFSNIMLINSGYNRWLILILFRFFCSNSFKLSLTC